MSRICCVILILYTKRENGLEWLKSQGMNTILSIAEENYSVLKPTAVIFNLGVNDPGNMYDYISYYQEIAESLQKKKLQAVLYVSESGEQ